MAAQVAKHSISQMILVAHRCASGLSSAGLQAVERLRFDFVLKGRRFKPPRTAAE